MYQYTFHIRPFFTIKPASTPFRQLQVLLPRARVVEYDRGLRPNDSISKQAVECHQKESIDPTPLILLGWYRHPVGAIYLT